MRKIIFGDFLLLAGSIYALMAFVLIPAYWIHNKLSEKIAEQEILTIVICVITAASWSLLILSLVVLRIFYKEKHKLTVLFGVCYLAMWTYFITEEGYIKHNTITSLGGERTWTLLAFGHLILFSLLIHHIWHVKRKD